MKQPFRFFAAAIVLVGGGIGPAARQALAADVVPPYEVFTIVRSMGLSPLGQPALRGGVYVLRAGNRYGEQVRVVVDARAGQVVSVEPFARGPDQYLGPVRRPPAEIPNPRTGTYEQGPRIIPADPRYVPRGGPRPPPPASFELDDELDEEDVGALPPRRDPPRVITAPRFPDLPTASTRSAAVAPNGGRTAMPAKPPLPRPRPASTLASGQPPAGDVTGSVAAQPSKSAMPPPETRPDPATPPMQGFE